MKASVGGGPDRFPDRHFLWRPPSRIFYKIRYPFTADRIDTGMSDAIENPYVLTAERAESPPATWLGRMK
ncbi:MAG TPA: hypothetical protein VM511_05820, partial [Luteolibacter sp.]|nr:hypothetical protein [Luteolibacter sp.]